VEVAAPNSLRRSRSVAEFLAGASPCKKPADVDEHTWTFVGATTQPDNLQTTGQMNLKGAETTAASEAITRSIHRSWAQLEYLLGRKKLRSWFLIR